MLITTLRTNLSSTENLVEQFLSHPGITYTSVTYAIALPIFLQSRGYLNCYHYLLLPLQGSLQSQHPPSPSYWSLHQIPKLPNQLAQKGRYGFLPLVSTAGT